MILLCWFLSSVLLGGSVLWIALLVSATPCSVGQLELVSLSSFRPWFVSQIQALLSLLFLQVHLASWSAVAVCLSCLPFVAGLVLVLFPQVKLLGQIDWWMLPPFVTASCSLVCLCSVCVAVAAVIPDCLQGWV